MKAVVVSAPDTVPACGEFDDPVPSPGEEEFELVAAGLHQIVRSRASGAHYTSSGVFPNVPGVDAVARAADGRLVYTGWIRPPWGTMAERMAARAGIALPASADPLAVAAGVNPAMSGWLPLRRLTRTRSLGTVLVVGATGASGRLAVQAAFALGAQRVVAAGRDRGRLDVVAGYGAVPVALGEPDAVAALGAALAGEAPSIVLDYVWGPVAELVFAALNRNEFDGSGGGETVYTQIGALAGRFAALPADLLRSRPIRVEGSGVGSVSAEVILAELPEIIALIADGSLSVPYTPFTLDRVADAWTHSGDRAVITP
jgi:NADPH:quinone reductase-like Zn-dependent oxidoreductase